MSVVPSPSGPMLCGENNAAFGTLGDAELAVHARKVAALGSLDRFDDYCRKCDISIENQVLIISRLTGCNVAFDYLRQLLGRGKELREMIDNLRALASTGVPSADLAATLPTPSSAHSLQPGSIALFCLTERGGAVGYDGWHACFEAMEELGLAARGQGRELERAFGVARHYGRKPWDLRQPAEVLMSKKALAQLVVLLYGRRTYELPCDRTVRGHLLPRGCYGSEPLIKTTEGSGLRADGQTYDPYWQVLDGAVHYRGRKTPLSSRPTHGYITALRTPVDVATAANILYCLDCLMPGGWLRTASDASNQ